VIFLVHRGWERTKKEKHIMNQTEFNPRQLMALIGAATTGMGTMAHAQDALKVWAPGIARVGAQDWSDMKAQAGIRIDSIAKSVRADGSIKKVVVSDGNLFSMCGS
jgi:putative spermidine/putrescine transport system substrate-binding protein